MQTLSFLFTQLIVPYPATLVARKRKNAKESTKSHSKLSHSHWSTSILPFLPVGPSHSPADAGQFEIRNSADGHGMPLRALPKSAEAYNLNNVCNAALTSADRPMV